MSKNLFEFTNINDLKSVSNEEIEWYIQKPLDELYLILNIAEASTVFEYSPKDERAKISSYTLQCRVDYFNRHKEKIQALLCPKSERIKEYEIGGDLNVLLAYIVGNLTGPGFIPIAVAIAVALIVIKISIVKLCKN